MDPRELAATQTILYRNIAIGVASGFLLLLGLYVYLPQPGPAATAIDRLVLALRCDAVAALTLFAGIHAVARLRGQSEAMNPLAGKDPADLQVHSRYLQNTLEQLVLFVVGTAALSTYLDAGTARALPALTVVFVAARVVFWRGYLRHPLGRTIGMAATFLVNLVVFGTVIYFTIRTGFAG